MVLADAPLFVDDVLRVLAHDGIVVWPNALDIDAPHCIPLMSTTSSGGGRRRRCERRDTMMPHQARRGSGIGLPLVRPQPDSEEPSL